jgi:predicted nucleic acid-binding protein
VTDYHLDASALVKRYAPEPGSDWVLEITEPTAGHTIILAEITLAEVAAALAAKHRAPQGLTLEERDRALSRFLQDCAETFLLLQVDRSVIDQAVELTQSHRLRGYDAVQLATALIANDDLVEQEHPPLVFVASDNDLLAAARAEGLTADNPLEHLHLV